METIISKSNAHVKLVKALAIKSSRVKYNLYYLEGIKVVLEAINKVKAIDIQFIASSKEILQTLNGGMACLKQIEVFCREKQVKLMDIEKNIFKEMTDTVTPQGILIVIASEPKSIEQITQKIIDNNQNVMLLDQVQDMGNVGTIIRTCLAFGITTILCTIGTADCYLPKALRSTMGAILDIDIIYVTIDELKKIKQDTMLTIVGLSLSAEKTIKQLAFDSSTYLFAMGNEASGLSNSLLALCDITVKIEMNDRMESLNVATASAIVLYEQYQK